MNHGNLCGPVWKFENGEEQIKIHQWVRKGKLASGMKLSYLINQIKRWSQEKLKVLWKFGNFTVMFTEIIRQTHSVVCYLCPAVFISILVFAILSDQLQGKPSYGKIASPPCETQGFLETCKFHHESNSSELSKHWLVQLSENPVEGICGWSLFAKEETFLSAVFSNKFFRLKQIL